MNNQLEEKDFIKEGYRKNPYPFWLWIFLLTAFIAIIWGAEFWFSGFFKKEVSSRPFLNVTNRQFSLFLWQNPSFMRSNVQNKTGYLTAFQFRNTDTMDPVQADTLVEAPPEILFLYHTWFRLIKNEFAERKITVPEFRKFLDAVEEWKPEYWSEAPKDYVQLINSLPSIKIEDLSTLPRTTLPVDVRQAFIGWKNYFIEGSKINAMTPTYAQVKAFLSKYPHYARNFWRNIVDSENMSYLKTLTLGKFEPSDLIPENELTPFLKVALYNAEQEKK